MSEIVSFLKGILMMDSTENSPVGLCSFEHGEKAKKKKAVKKVQRKRELRLSELME
jgi:hypothetical protein